MKCPVCDGKPHYVEEDLGEGTIVWGDCDYCKRTGRISLWHWLSYKWWTGWCPVWLEEWYIDREYEKWLKKQPKEQSL